MKTLTALAWVAALAAASDAAAQQPTTPNLSTTGRWDVAGQLALLNRNRPGLSRWDEWYSAAAVDGSVGRYWTPHVKTEIEVGTAGEGSIDGEESFRYREHKLRETTLGATLMYQFFDNQWVHPFVGAGVELARERHIAPGLPADLFRPVPTPVVRLPAVAPIDALSYFVRPLVTGGFKFYVTPHAFIRMEIRSSVMPADGSLALQWRGGVGVDF
jgi:outer membrane protein W